MAGMVMTGEAMLLLCAEKGVLSEVAESGVMPLFAETGVG
jgi:hypothetical protein